ncbi:MAG: gfo/Idh/MocA family oxidoreductase [Bacteroidales bacterium]|nr:gfo/Idh/MocA family oxidoreductase [Bacteroidales bacterium]
MKSIKRRDFLAGIASVPLLGNTREFTEEESKASSAAGKSDPLRFGIIGYGRRGEELLGASMGTGGGQADLNIELRAVSEIYKLRMERGLAAAGSKARAYKSYLDLLDSDNIDAVIIATPDHWHAPMAIEAAQRGKHIYLEKCMTRTVDEAKAVRDAVKKSEVVFQLGHQGRQRDLNLKARELIANGTLGKLSLIETTTNRNNEQEGWKTEEYKRLSKDALDWDMFEGPSANNKPFSPERYFAWRNYWDYGTGMSGDLLSNEFDVINSILDLGIPESAVATGGLYHHLDGREVPDVFQAAFEYPQNAFTLLYSGTLASGIPRGTLFMGTDATLELGRILSVWADKQSIKYKSRIKAGMIDPSAPFVNYEREQNGVDAVSSATSKYYADRGLAHTYREGKEFNTTQLHLAEWLHCIRSGGLTSCNIDRGFEEAITSHMATLSFQEGRKVKWDHETETII